MFIADTAGVQAMADRANVRSIETIADFRAKLTTYLHTARTAISEANSDVMRVQRWVDETQKHNWSMRHKKTRQKLANTRSDLERAKISRPDAHPSMFVDQQRAVARAKLEMEQCEEKLRLIQRWSRELDRESMMFKGHMNRLDRMIEGDMSRASTWLAKLVKHLEDYTATPPPKLPVPQDDTDPTASRRRAPASDPQGDTDEPSIDTDETPEKHA
ncbi:MAG: hypothetical protein P8K80_08775 [Phycisphaerales bacterium]|nr:hypothetical protein [Phycisphaerales bacterium]